MSKMWHAIYLTAIAVMLGLILWIAIVEIDSHRNEPDSSNFSSLAILPFVAIGTDSTLDQLSRTITEETVLSLNSHLGLEVKSGSQLGQFVGASVSIRDIGIELGVAAVLDGAVRRYGQRLRVTAQLIDAETEIHLWSESYDVSDNDLSSVATHIAKEISRFSKS